MPDSIEYNISVSNNAVRDLLIARLSAAGADGFEEEKKALKAYTVKGQIDEAAFENIIKNEGVTFSKSVISERNWNAEWESDFKPVTVENFCCIRASFHAPDPSAIHDIIITPKMSFGTGHHATTHLMVAAMQRLALAGKTVFDFGTGTGVLSILAQKCNAGRVTAIDNDDWSINNAIENFDVNKCHNIHLYKDEALPTDQQFDTILANINRNIILQTMASLKQQLAPGGVLLLSGLLTGDEELVLAEAEKRLLKLKEKTVLNGWICLLMVHG